MRVRNFLDFESQGLTRREKLSLILQASEQARERVQSESERRELEFVYQDSLTALSSLSEILHGEDQWLDRRIGRMSRVLNYYEGIIVRLNRRYWWIFFAIGMALLLLAIIQGSSYDSSAY